MATIALCMIVKNEEATLGRCLSSVADAVDEIVIADTGSTDQTVSIARSFGARVFWFPWIDDFAAARNFSFSKAKMDFCLWMDADDVILPEDLPKLKELKETLTDQVDAVFFPYYAAVDENGKPTFSFERERLIRRAASLCWEGAVHEAIAVPSGRVFHANVPVYHRKEKAPDKERNLRIYERQKERGCKFTLRETVYFAREYRDHGRYAEAEELLDPVLAAGQGWAVLLQDAAALKAECRRAAGDPEGELAALTQSLQFAPPSPELCCAFGAWFFQAERYQEAHWWYESALRSEPLPGAFSQPACRDFLPAIQLCVCCWRLGDREQARRWNEKAASFRPDSAAVAYNRQFFKE